MEVEKILNILHETCSLLKDKTQVVNNDQLADMSSIFSIGDNVIGHDSACELTKLLVSSWISHSQSAEWLADSHLYWSG